tara:strand:+ start:224 stop:427 length:204 start_codon:yes stop_codon:yes gene_type:complete
MATACRCGFPSRLSLEIFALMVSLLDPFFSGMTYFLDRLPLHFHLLRLKRNGELGSFAAEGCAFICP